MARRKTLSRSFVILITIFCRSEHGSFVILIPFFCHPELVLLSSPDPGSFVVLSTVLSF